MSGFNSDPLTLTRYIISEQRKHPEATGDLSTILNAIAVASKSISSAVRRAGLQNLYGLHGTQNVTGDEVKKLDIISNEIFCNVLARTGRIAVMVSEEDEGALIVKESDSNARYIAVFDPLDGSSNIDCNVSVGSIFGIYRRDPSRVGQAPTAEEPLMGGSKLILAGYTMYGSSTQLVLTFNDGGKKDVNIFTLDPTIGEFLLSHASVQIPEKAQKIYSCNEGNVASFPQFVQRFISEAKSGEKPYSLRYVGSMVADVHRTILYGGVFIYPATGSAPNGKLRLLYECNPMSLIMEAAGGRAITGLLNANKTGSTRVLDIHPTGIHQRSPIILGCKRDVDLIEKMLVESAN